MSSPMPPLATIQKALADFQLSPSTFRILYSISSSASPRLSSPPPKTLYILDSSFNPPTLAHLDMATSALHSQHHHHASSSCSSPCRLLLLLSTQNADKQLEPASFERRLIMMGFLAGEIARTVGAKGGRKMKSETSSRRWRPPISSDDATGDNDNDLESGDAAESENKNINNNHNNNNSGDDDDAVTVDIGVTKMPYFHDKAAAIAASAVYYAHSPLGGENGEDTNHQDKMEQVYLVGFDTLIRLLDPKYYPPSRESLRALDPFFSTSKVRVTRRASGTGDGCELQDEYVRALAAGEKEVEGGRREWAQRVQLVGRGGGEEETISSTKVRQAMKMGDEEVMKRLVPDEVGRYILDQGIYLSGRESKHGFGEKGGEKGVGVREILPGVE